MSVQMELYKIIISEMAEQQIIWLKEVDGERKFPIVIGNPEAMAIDRRLKGERVDHAAQVGLEFFLVGRLPPRDVAPATLIVRTGEAEILRPGHQYIVDEDNRVATDAKPLGHRRIAIFLCHHFHSRTNSCRNVLDQQTCWIGQRSRERPADERDGDLRRSRLTTHQRERRGQCGNQCLHRFTIPTYSGMTTSMIAVAAILPCGSALSSWTAAICKKSSAML